MKHDLAKRLLICYAVVIVAFVILIGFASSSVLAASIENTVLRVGLIRFLRSVKTVTISAAGGVSVRNTSNEQLKPSMSNCAKVNFTASQSGIAVKTDNCVLTIFHSTLTITPTRPEEPLRIESPTRPAKQYRGSVEISLKDGVLVLINIVGLEDYVRGVLPEEMPASYPMESLKAQAVAVRTYALANKGKHKSEGYDICDTNMCQLYGGVSVENTTCSKAVEETAGTLLVFDGQPADVLYSTDCGGVTQDYSEFHPGKIVPYLRMVTDPPSIQHSSWELVYSLKELENKLVKAGINQAQGLVDIRIIKTSSSGRPLEVEITGLNEKIVISGIKFRNALGSCTLKSTLYTLEKTTDGNVMIRGKGLGHGHGMCQIGARELALPPYNYTYDRILSHYFPGTTLQMSTKSVQTLANRVTNESDMLNHQICRSESLQHKDDNVCQPNNHYKDSAKGEELKLKVRLKPPDSL